MRFPALSILLIAALASAAKAETLNTVFTQTRDCFDCPMGVAGDLSIKVCGNRGCCFSFRLDNGENNFQRGDYDEFTDGLVLDFVEILTSNRLAYCSVGYELDNE